MKKAIVTGANGFVGAAVCEELTTKGIAVIAVVRNKSENIDRIINLPNLRIVYCDMNRFKTLAEVVSDKDIDIMYHFAWAGSAGPLRGDVDTQINNIKYTCDTINACNEMGCHRFVFASSIMEYEIQASMTTDSTPGINTLYSSAKLATDYMVRTLAGQMKIDYIRAVISNIYGPGEMSPRLINTSIRKMLSGEHCAFSAGNQLYDFIYVTDAAKAFAAIGEKGLSNRTYYIGSLKPRPLKEYLNLMKNQIDSNIALGLGEIPYNGISLTYKEFDVNAVKNDTGFVPEVDFESGIRKTIRWIKERI